MKFISYIFTFIVLSVVSIFLLNELYRWAGREFGDFRFENYYSYYGDIEKNLNDYFPNGSNVNELVSELEEKGAQCNKNQYKNREESGHMKSQGFEYPAYDYVCAKMLNFYRVAISVYAKEGKVTKIEVKFFGEFYI